MSQRAIHCLFLGVVIGVLLAVSMPPRLFGTAYAAGRQAAAPVALHLNSTATPSGAANAYPLNETFDADVQAAGTPPANSGFETAPSSIGTPPTNYDFSQSPTLAGTPPANYNFATGTLSSWTGDGGTVKSDPNHGYYADLNWNTITSSPFTIDNATQSFTFDVDFLSGSAMYVYVLSGSGYANSNQMAYLYCSSCGWQTKSIDITSFKGQSVEIQFKAYFSEIGVTNVRGQVLFPGFTTTGTLSRDTDSGGDVYAALHTTNGTLTSSAYTIDPSAQAASVRIYGVASSGDAYTIKILSGARHDDSGRLRLRHLRRLDGGDV